MKIQEKFIPLILSGKKKYEIRNNFQNSSGEFQGLYKIENKWFSLKECCRYKLSKYETFEKCVEAVLYFHNIDKETEKWILENEKYFNETGFIEIFKWIELEDANYLELKNLEIITGGK